MYICICGIENQQPVRKKRHLKAAQESRKSRRRSAESRRVDGLSSLFCITNIPQDEIRGERRENEFEQVGQEKNGIIEINEANVNCRLFRGFLFKEFNNLNEIILKVNSENQWLRWAAYRFSEK
jgi:hypothetical protein